MLRVDVAEVGDEGVLVAGLAHFMVDGSDVLVERLANQLLGIDGGMVQSQQEATS